MIQCKVLKNLGECTKHYIPNSQLHKINRFEYIFLLNHCLAQMNKNNFNEHVYVTPH